jgi:hypothetical protein
MTELRDAAYYRERAIFMRSKADKAETDSLRASYLTAAADWEKLADEAEKRQKNPAAR